ncbi:MAG: TonB family protein [Saprospiraceae bacterium]|jgi:TonB family protein
MTGFKENKKGKRKGVITTLSVHVFVLLLCVFLGFTYQNPPPGEIDINFGFEDGGTSNELATTENPTDVPQEKEAATKQAQNTPVQENLNTQKESTSEVAKQTNNSKENSSQNTENTENSETKKEAEKLSESLKSANLSSLLQGKDSPGGKGDGGEEGNKGDPDGVSNGQSIGGGGKGDMFDFGGRKAVKRGNLKHECGLRASVDIRVNVDRDGNVINAVVVGGTNLNNCIEKKAIAAAKGTKYNANPNGPKSQEGRITLEFHVN